MGGAARNELKGLRIEVLPLGGRDVAAAGSSGARWRRGRLWGLLPLLSLALLLWRHDAG